MMAGFSRNSPAAVLLSRSVVKSAPSAIPPRFNVAGPSSVESGSTGKTSACDMAGASKSALVSAPARQTIGFRLVRRTFLPEQVPAQRCDISHFLELRIMGCLPATVAVSYLKSPEASMNRLLTPAALAAFALVLLAGCAGKPESAPMALNNGDPHSTNPDRIICRRPAATSPRTRRSATLGQSGRRLKNIRKKPFAMDSGCRDRAPALVLANTPRCARNHG